MSWQVIVYLGWPIAVDLCFFAAWVLWRNLVRPASVFDRALVSGIKWLFAVLIATVAVAVLAWAIDRDVPTQVISAQADPQKVYPGTSLYIAYTIIRDKSCPRRIHRVILDGQGVQFDLGEQDADMTAILGLDQYRQGVFIPPSARPGPARYRATVENYCNPIQHFWPIVQTVEVRFNIVAW